MKKLSKRFLTLAIACVMAMAMAVPAFADFDNGTTHTYHEPVWHWRCVCIA